MGNSTKVDQGKIYKYLSYFIAAVWFVNGLFCKIIGLVPRHREIVAVILGDKNAHLYIFLIGLGEVILAFWILRGKWIKGTAIFQVIVILTMNILEFLLADKFLLWGKLNIVFAIVFCCIIIFHAYKQPKKLT